MTREQLEEIATLKMPDLTAADMDAAVRTIAGSARSAGIEDGGRVMGKLTKAPASNRREGGAGHKQLPHR